MKEEIRMWRYCRDMSQAYLEAMDEAITALTRARAACEALQRQASEEALALWDRAVEEEEA